MSKEKQSFAAWLEAARNRKGWSQNELGRRAGLGEATVYRLEMGKRKPHSQTRKAIEAALGEKSE